MHRHLAAWLWLVSLALLATRAIFIGTTMVIDDEAYYAMYARHLDMGYIDHGPLIAYVIRLFTTIFGENGVGVRAGGVVFITILSYALFVFGRRHFSTATGAALSLTVSANMLTHTNAVVVTPDAPLAFFATLAIVFYYLAFFVDRRHFYLAGALLGLAMLSKISALFPGLGIALFPVVFANKRHFLKDPRYYASFVIALIVFMPFIIWNMQNDYAFFRYQGAHVARGGDVSSFFELWGALFLLVGPAAFIYSAMTPLRLLALRGVRSMTGWQKYFGIVTLVPLLYFVIQSLVSRMEINWPAPVFFGGLFLFGIAVGEKWENRKRTVAFQVGLSLILIAVVTVLVYVRLLPMNNDADPTGRYYSYAAIRDELGEVLHNNPDMKGLRIVANNYQLPSMVNMYQKPDKEAVCLAIRYHDTLYSFLYPDDTLIGDDFVFVAESHDFPRHLRSYFADVTQRGLIESRRQGRIVNTFTVWHVTDYEGRGDGTH